MIEQPYSSEDTLQSLLADYPDLLAGDQSEGEPRRWLLLAREAPVGDAQSDSRWSVDHLFVDQDAIPTIVEVKRSDDTRIRREVVSQMLEYAANATAYWRLDDLRARFGTAARSTGQDPDDILADLLQDDRTGPDQFWQSLRTNLAASKVRLVFVSDEIPPELRRLVEFLNEQLTSAEVLAIEVKQYVDAKGHHQTLVPRLIGQTERANQAKGRAPSRRWDRDTLRRELQERHGAAAADTAREILDWAAQLGLRVEYGRGARDGSLMPGSDEGAACYPFALYTYGRIEIQFQSLRRRSPFDDLERRKELQAKLNAIPGVGIPDDRLGIRPSFALEVLQPQAALDAFLKTMRWVIDEVRSAPVTH